MQGYLASSQNCKENAAVVLYKIRKKYGVRTVFRGLLPTVARDTLSFGAYFGVYFGLREVLDFDSNDTIYSFTSGGFAGMACWLVSYPFDVVKSMIQTDPLIEKERRYRARNQYLEVKKCLDVNFKKKGHWKWLLQGLKFTLIRAFVVNSVTFGITMKCIELYEDREVKRLEQAARTW